MKLRASSSCQMPTLPIPVAGLPYEKNRVLREARDRGLGNAALEDIEITGESIDRTRIADFKLPKTELMYRFPTVISKHMAKIVNFRPFINECLCKKCNVCKEACPVEVIVINEEISKIDEEKCARCFCCHEVCPHDAIYIKKNFFAKLIWR